MRKTKLFIATLAMSMLLSSTSLAGTWQAQDNGQWKYQNDDGSFATGLKMAVKATTWTPMA